jgi:hypothetical protein
MNIYVVVEGRAEKKIYKSWIPLVNPNLSFVDHISSVSNNNFIIVTGGGYPQYFSVIDSAISDVNDTNLFGRLVISIDSEDMTHEEKRSEVLNHLAEHECSTEVKVVIQHFCFETWALGNRRLVRKEPRTPDLRMYKRLFNVRANDPELLPAHPEKSLNRSQFAFKYLRAALFDRYKNLSYSKGSPEIVGHHKYFEQVRTRLQETQHIRSFETFLSAFQT